MVERSRVPALEIKDLNVFYGASHALQGGDLKLEGGVLSVVGRNGMGKTTLCKAIMGMVPVASGTINFSGQSLVGKTPAEIARIGIGYVPQGRRLWRSLSVDEHLKMVATKSGAWTVERIYSTFPRLAERKNNGGGQLSGGEQQMLAISRALLSNPRLLVMDEPTEGLAPVIVAQVEDMLLRLADEGDMEVLVIEQNIGVACGISDNVAIMVNGRINRIAPAAELAGDRDLQQRLLGVGRHSHDDTPAQPAIAAAGTSKEEAAKADARTSGTVKIYQSNPTAPTRWSQPVPVAQLERSGRVITAGPTNRASAEQAEIRQLASPGDSVVLVAGTLDTKGDELRFIRDQVRAAGLPVRMVDLSTSGEHSGAEIPANQIAAFHPRGSAGVFTGDRGQSVAGMTLAFERWIARQQGIGGIISAGGSGGTAIVAPAMRTLPVGVPKLIVSTVASGEVSKYVGPSDITMMHSVADVQGLNTITREVLSNAAQAMAGMVKARRGAKEAVQGKPAVGLTMFGVTTPCVRQIVDLLDDTHDCLVFHATGIGGRSMEKLVESGKTSGVIDITTTEVCDLMMDGVFPATEDRFGAVIRTRIPFIGSVGALDMVNFAAPETVPEKYKDRTFYVHNPQVTLMRTTVEECAAMGRWIGERLNQMEGQVRFFLPEGGVSALDAPGQAFHDPEARAAVYEALQSTVRQTSNRQLIRLPHHINDPAFAAAVVAAFRALHGGGRPVRKREARR
ncbi:amino acid/amide ABC transporter ATP-binding protein 2 (HAAT family) [Hoeflea halophila]|uniref:Amino acid/amide ABC transporter ATP-binding protein 2 (HAAT family) n=1 Tax=Hoeflea halophila TaxID=714899 RepID=A0A286IAU7_9HYPH|nr:ABC transporter permease [Hoeflea halophila]SOE17248.1 amino acid/amide ABC transporter ATP-binding protein 2 (HAAT family) [Hoeflea halophila]